MLPRGQNLEPNVPFFRLEKVSANSLAATSEEMRRTMANIRASKRKALEPIFLSKHYYQRNYYWRKMI